MKEIQTIIRVKETLITTRATELSLLMKSARKWIKRVATQTEIQTTIQTETLIIRVREANFNKQMIKLSERAAF